MNTLTVKSGTDARPGFGVRLARCFWAVALTSSALLSRAAAQPPSPVRSPSASSNAQADPELSGAGFLEQVWPGHPEWLAMLADIAIKGDRLQGTDGWFRNDRPQTRFDWQSTRAAWDRDGNGSVSRSEFPGTDNDFALASTASTTMRFMPTDFDFFVEIADQLYRDRWSSAALTETATVR